MTTEALPDREVICLDLALDDEFEWPDLPSRLPSTPPPPPSPTPPQKPVPGEEVEGNCLLCYAALLIKSCNYPILLLSPHLAIVPCVMNPEALQSPWLRSQCLAHVLRSPNLPFACMPCNPHVLQPQCLAISVPCNLNALGMFCDPHAFKVANCNPHVLQSPCLAIPMPCDRPMLQVHLLIRNDDSMFRCFHLNLVYSSCGCLTHASLLDFIPIAIPLVYVRQIS